MTALRLLIVTPRYWPLTGEPESVAACLAEQLRQRVEVTVVTAQWHASWPAEVIHHDARVVRLSPAPRGGWSSFRFLRVLGRWLRRELPRFDVVYVFNLRHEAHTAIAALRNASVPLVLRSQRCGVTGDCHWQERSRNGRRVRRESYSADAIVVPTRAIAEELVAVGYDAERVVVIPDGAVASGDRSEARRHHARQALADVNHDFACAEFAPVAVAVERLEAERGLPEMIRAWRVIAARWPSAKLWLIGDGPLRESLYEQIVDLGLHHRLIMPGSFDDAAEVFHAADLFLSPSPDCGVTPALLQAMHAGLPVVSAGAPDLPSIMEHGVHGLVGADQRAWVDAVSRFFEAPPAALQAGTAGRRAVAEKHDVRQTVSAHVELFERLREQAKV